MAQAGIPYELVGPDGSRAVFNDNTDADFVGYLDSENGITGLLDGADVRESFTNLTEGDGGVQGDNYLSRKTGTLQGVIFPGDASTTNIREGKLKRASRGLRAAGPCYLSWTPDGSVRRRLTLYRQGRVAITGRRPKQFLIPLSSPDPYQYSADVQSVIILPTASAGDAGFSSPISDPLTTAYAVSGSESVVNAGDAETWPVFRIDGPFTNPTLRNHTTGQQWTLSYDLADADYIVVDTKLRTVLLNGVSNRYSAYAANFAINEWWSLQPGANDVRVLESAYSGDAQVTVYWRHAFE